MLIKEKCFLFFILFGLLFPQLIFGGSQTFGYTNQSSLEEISSAVKFIKDSTKTLEIESVRRKDSKSWQDLPSPNLWFANGNVNYWFHFKIKNSTKKTLYLILPYPFLDKIDLYLSRDTTHWSLQTSGLLRPVDQRILPIHSYNFELAQPNQSVEGYLKVENSWVIIPLLLAGTSDLIYQAEIKWNVWQGIYIGIMLALFMYNFMLFVLLKEKVYIYYLIYLVAAFLISSHHSGFTCQYLWPCDQWILFDLVVNIIVGPATILFAQSFLQLKKHTPILNKILWVLIASYIPYLILFNYPSTKIWIGQILEFNNTLLPFILYGSSIYVLIKKKYRPALYYLLGWTLFFTSSIVLFRIYGGQIPYQQDLFNILELGSSAEAMLFSLALADRIRVLRTEKRKAEEAQREKQKEIELQAMANERKLLETEIKTQELERARIASDLHDELGLTLSLAKMAIQQSESTLSKDYIQQAKINVDNSITRLREITHNLHPSVVNTFGLASVIRRMLDNMASKYPFKITHYIDINISLPPATEVLVYRVFTELINNVIKHANATQLDVKFNKSENGEYNLIVTDNGVGIPKDTSLRSIQARMKILKGSYDITDRKGGGSQITISFPKE